MSVKSILVAFNGAPASRAALRLALDLAQEREAHVVGALAHGVARARSQLAPWLTTELDRMIAQQETTARADIEAAFWGAVDSQGEGTRARTTFCDITGDPTAALVDLGRTYDLIVMGRFESEAGAEHFSPSPDVVALQSGRPVLIAPPGLESRAFGRRVALAWDGKRAAARAMADALHVLPRDAHVTVLSIGSDEAKFRREHRDPVVTLQRHGVEAEFRMIESHGGIAASILNACAEIGADSLVMGAYEHSKFSEDLIGGVTARVLRSAELPVLMAH